MSTSYRLLRIALVVFGLLMLLLYPIAAVWRDVPALLLIAVVLAVLLRSSDVGITDARHGRAQ